MHLRSLLTLLALLPSLFLSAANSIPDGKLPPTSRKSAPADATPYLKFIKNVKQFESQVAYRGDLIGGRVWLRNDGFTFAFHDMAQLNALHNKYYHDKTYQTGEVMENEIVNVHSFKLDFLNANANPTLSKQGNPEPIYNY